MLSQVEVNVVNTELSTAATQPQSRLTPTEPSSVAKPLKGSCQLSIPESSPTAGRKLVIFSVYLRFEMK